MKKPAELICQRALFIDFVCNLLRRPLARHRVIKMMMVWAEHQVKAYNGPQILSIESAESMAF
jgi:hypothetical protein